jgi:hypothetical protein
MPIELGFWRLNGNQPARLESSGLDLESRLEDILASDLDILNPGLLLVGRQVPTRYGKFIDLLALDAQGNVVVIELKRDRTPRDVVAQLLDYGSWVRDLEVDQIASIFRDFLAKYHPQAAGVSLDQAFCKRFNQDKIPDEINERHELVIVASELDHSTERIVTYLADEYGAQINAVFFRVFKDREREYLSRVWLRDPKEVEQKTEERRERTSWNGEFYTSYYRGWDWEVARRLGFFRAGGGAWYSRTLDLLEEGSRIWVNIPGQGYVGVGEVLGTKKSQYEFTVQVDRVAHPIGDFVKDLRPAGTPVDDLDYFVPVRWLKAVSVAEAVRETGFFGNQNSVAQPRAARWTNTIAALKQRFNIPDPT